jgi:hypothetical protein
MKSRVLHILLFTLFINRLYAQPVVLQGTVVDTNNKPVAGASIIIRNKDSTGLMKYFKIADDNGNFKIAIPNANQQLCFQIAATGYLIFSEQLPIPILSFNKKFILKTFTGELPEVYVQGNPDIVKRGDTTTYKVANFEKGNESNIADLLKNLPGLSVTNFGKIIFNGKIIDRILLEGDDLFGEDYATLTNNVSTNGLDKIEVIENYKNKSKIENNQDSKGNETVLNLTYKKRKIKIFGTANTSAGAPIENYECKTDLLSLIPAFKFVVTSNFNSIGKTAYNALGKIKGISASNGFNENLVTPAATIDNVVNLNDIKPIQMSDNRAFTNASKFITFNSQQKIGKKIILKEAVHYLFDDYKQSSTNEDKFYFSTQELIIKRSNELIKNNKELNTALEATFTPNKNIQTVVHYNYNFIKGLHHNNGFLFNSPTQEALQQNIHNHQLTIGITKLFTTRKYITAQFQYSTNTLYSNYTIHSPVYDTSFKLPNTYTNLYQTFNAPATTIAGNVRYYYSKYRKSFALQLNAVENKFNIQLQNYLYNNVDSLMQLPNTYNNTSNLIDRSLSLKTELTFVLSSKFETSFTTELRWNNLTSEQINKTIKISNRNLFLLPTVSFKYKLNSSKTFYVYLSAKPMLPSISQLNSSYFFQGLTNIASGNHQLFASTAYNASISYHSFDPIGSGKIFFSNFTITNQPNSYLQNLTNRGLYTFSTLEYFNKDNLFMNLMFKLEKSIHHSKAWLIIANHFSGSNTYSLMNYQVNTNKSFNLQTELRIKTNWNNWFNFNIGAINNYQFFKTFYTNKPNVHFTANSFIANSTFHFKVFKKLNLDMLVDYLINKPQELKSKQLLFVDAQAFYPINKNVRLGFIAKNIFNNTKFIQSDINAYQTTVTYFNLQPAFYLISCTVKF